MTWTLTKKRMGRLESAFSVAAFNAVTEHRPDPDMELFAKGATFAMQYVGDIVENGSSDMELTDYDKISEALVKRFDELIDEGPIWSKR